MLPMNNFTAANTSRREIMDAAEQVEGMLPAGSGICFLNVLHALNAFETMAEAEPVPLKDTVWAPAVALSATVSFPTRLPVAVGGRHAEFTGSHCPELRDVEHETV